MACVLRSFIRPKHIRDDGLEAFPAVRDHAPKISALSGGDCVRKECTSEGWEAETSAENPVELAHLEQRGECDARAVRPDRDRCVGVRVNVAVESEKEREREGGEEG